MKIGALFTTLDPAPLRHIALALLSVQDKKNRLLTQQLAELEAALKLAR